MANFASSKNLGNGYPKPGPQHPDIQDIMNHAYFLTEGQWKEARENNSYDYVVIGSGFCGYAFAKRVLEKDKNATILMIERGGFLLPTHFQNLGTSYKKLVGPISETFPWTLSQSTMLEKAPYRVTQHGMLPYFGGRSFLWSAWCPQPEQSQAEKWSPELLKSLNQKGDNGTSYFDDAKTLLHVHKSNQLPFSKNLQQLKLVDNLKALQLPEYGVLQQAIYERFDNNRVSFNSLDPTQGNSTGASLMKVEYASLACGDGENKGIDFNKFSTPTGILNLIDSTAFDTKEENQELTKKRKERNNMYPNRLHIVTECVVEEILNENNQAYALSTSRGTVALNDAELILATGSMPPATLIQKSFDHKLAGNHFTAHTISAITARVKKTKFIETMGEGTISENGNLQMGAIYLPFFAKNGQQFHIQMSIIHDPNPKENNELAMRYMPDVVSTASPEQLAGSEDAVILVCAILGELDIHNPTSSFHPHKDSDANTASLLRCNPSDLDKETWNDMGNAAYDIVDFLFGKPEYWYSDLNYYQESLVGGFSKAELEARKKIENTWVANEARTRYPHVPAMVHEGSTLPIENNNGIEAVVNLDYQLINNDGKPVTNLFVTGASLWAQSGAWNPTLTMTAMALQLADKRCTAKAARILAKQVKPTAVLSLINQSK